MPKNGQTPAPPRRTAHSAQRRQLCARRRAVASFLEEIGLTVHVLEAVRDKAFVPEVEIVGGALHVTPNGKISDWLHEAGHLCCVPKRYRSGLSGNLETGIKAMCHDLDTLSLETASTGWCMPACASPRGGLTDTPRC